MQLLGSILLLPLQLLRALFLRKLALCSEQAVFKFVYSKKVTNTTKQAVNTTHASGAADSLRFVTFCSWRTSAINKGLHVLLLVTFNILFFIPLVTPL